MLLPVFPLSSGEDWQFSTRAVHSCQKEQTYLFLLCEPEQNDPAGYMKSKWGSIHLGTCAVQTPNSIPALLWSTATLQKWDLSTTLQAVQIVGHVNFPPECLPLSVFSQGKRESKTLTLPVLCRLCFHRFYFWEWSDLPNLDVTCDLEINFHMLFKPCHYHSSLVIYKKNTHTLSGNINMWSYYLDTVILQISCPSPLNFVAVLDVMLGCNS